VSVQLISMKIGDKIIVNKGQPETLIKISGSYCLFKNEKGQIVRNLMHIKNSEKINYEKTTIPTE